MTFRSASVRAVSVSIAIFVALTPAAAQGPRPSLRIGTSGSVIKIDGIVDDAAWAAADSIANLTQIEPVEGLAPTGRTVVRVLSTGDAIVFGVRAYDPDAERITSFARNRDASLTSEDHIRIVLDTYLDGRSGYVFIINPHGARYDALVANQGEGENAQWDGIWEAATHRDSAGWSAEIMIPVKSLLFKRGLTEWGFNVERRIQRLLESSRWFAYRYPGLRPWTRHERPAVGDLLHRQAGACDIGRLRCLRQPRCHQTRRCEYVRLAHHQHRLRGN
jgi:hypothetical protein